MNIRRELKGTYAVWYREVKVFSRERSRIVTSVAYPFFFYIIFGSSLGSLVEIPGVNYQDFIFPGFLAMAIIFTSTFQGAYVIWDRKLDFLKEVLVAPISRTATFIGKVLGGMTDVLIEVAIFIGLGLVMGIPFTALNMLYVILISGMLALGLVGAGLIIGSFMDSPTSFNLIVTFFIFPVFLLSGAFYPLNTLPGWMLPLTKINPATYAVEGMRSALFNVSTISITEAFTVLLLFDIAIIITGTWAFRRMKV